MPSSQPKPTPKLHVTKTLTSGQAGTKKWSRKYGDALLFVRYRQDESRLTRYTTVELIVDSEHIASKSQREVAVRLGPHESALQAEAWRAGATWNMEERLWRMPLSLAHALGLAGRVVEGVIKHDQG